MKKPLTHLILAGGIFHDFAASSEALATILAPLGIESRIEWDLEAGLAGLAESPVDLLSINALRWQMIGEKYDPYRDTEAFTPSQSARSALQLYLTTGGALLGLHTASICFSDWPEWQSLLGGRWVWGSSWHPAPEPVTIAIEPNTALSHLPAFTVHDELYSDLKLDPDTTVLATGVSHAMVTPQPVIWQHQVGQGRVVYDALGHDSASLNHPTHAQLLRDAAQWAVRGGNPS
jgi:hypothetical protein